MKLDTLLVCNSCGAKVAGFPGPRLTCPNQGSDDNHQHHVLQPNRDLPVEMFHYLASQAAATTTTTTTAVADQNPFVRYRALLYPYRLALSLGISDQRYLELVSDLCRKLNSSNNNTPAFHRTPLLWSDTLTAFCKDETNQVAQSHKARHLFNVLMYYLVLQEVATTTKKNNTHNNEQPSPKRRPRLAVASCGNAGLAAATLAAAANWDIDVCIPQPQDDDNSNHNHDDTILQQLQALGPRVNVVQCARSLEPVQVLPNLLVDPSKEDAAADPTVAVFRQLVHQHGSWPFTVQGTECGLAVEGGQTLAWEILEQTTNKNVAFSNVFLQVGGGALAAGVYQGFQRAIVQGELTAILPTTTLPSSLPQRMPKLITVQAQGAAPLRRAVLKLQQGHTTIQDVCQSQRQHEYMFPWKHPSSIAFGILDDETYDWVELVKGMEATNGNSIVVSEEAIRDANKLVKSELHVNVCHTGSVGVAGLLSKKDFSSQGQGMPPSICILSGQDRSSSKPRRFCSVQDGITFCILESTYDYNMLFKFNKQHGSSPMNFIPDEPTLEHLSKLSTGETNVWAAFNEEKELVGFLSVANDSEYWLETRVSKDRDDDAVCFVHEFVVRGDQRGKRIGASLASLSVDPEFGIFSLVPSVAEIYTTVHVANIASRTAFLKSGYREVLTYNDSVRRRNTTVLKFSKDVAQEPRGNAQRMRVVGVQSGNAVDGIDVGIFDFEPLKRSKHDPRKLAGPVKYSTLANKTFLFTAEERKYILGLRAMRLEDGNGYAEGNYRIGEWCANRIEKLIEESRIDKASIALIGSHGQTVSGHPHWELGDISVIAQRTGITVAGDFRPADVAAGGNGTPCTCTYDSIMLRPVDGEKWRICINIGGTSSVTFCPPWPVPSDQKSNDDLLPRGLDPGLGVFFMDLTAQVIDPQLSYDVDGRMARSGTINEALLSHFLLYRYYQQRELPIGVGPDDFPETLWEQWRARAHSEGISDLDLMATLTELTARQIAIACAKFGGEHVRGGKTDDVLVRGGVCYNLYFMERLHWNLEQQLHLKIDRVKTLEDFGIDSESWEIAMYAMFGYLCYNNVYNFVPSCTGACRPVVGGRIAPGDNLHSIRLLGMPV